MHAEVFQDQDRVVVATTYEYMSPGVILCAAVCHYGNYINIVLY